jgi:hypothetical protein
MWLQVALIWTLFILALLEQLAVTSATRPSQTVTKKKLKIYDLPLSFIDLNRVTVLGSVHLDCISSDSSAALIFTYRARLYSFTSSTDCDRVAFGEMGLLRCNG